jgi:Transcriptional regulator, AbiEi antitoxin
MESELAPTLRYLARRQSGLVSRCQARQAGLSEDMIKFRVKSGRWRQIQRAHGLPESARHVPFIKSGGRRGRRDRVYEPFGLVIELDGRLAHSPEDQWKDKTRDNAAAADGKQTLRYGWSQVKWQPCETAAEVARALRRHGWNGNPRTCSPGCPVQRDLPG